MGNIKLLDCTLRDGGFVNDWEFGYDTILNIFERLVSAQLDIIEIGFIDQRRSFDLNRTIMPNTASVNKIYGNLQKGDSMVVGMIDYGTCDLTNIEPCKNTYLEGLRVIFKKKDWVEAIAYCSCLIEKGYQVFVQPVSITSYTDEEFYELIQKVNKIHPYAMSIVDTYGLLHKNNLLHYFNILNEELLSDIEIGYHSHNNFQLAYANSLELMTLSIKRTLVIDASVYGMGKGAGNANMELLAMYYNDNIKKKYKINQLLEIIDGSIMKFYLKDPWGYSMRYYLSASNDCHPQYVQYLTKKRTLSVKSINEILIQISEDKKLAYHEEYIERLYIQYQDKEVNDNEAILNLRKLFQEKDILILGPGKSVFTKKNCIQEFINNNNPIIISINMNPAYFKTDYIFISNAKRYIGLANRLKNFKGKTIATSNVTETNECFDFKLNYSTLVDMNFSIIDNSFVMFLKLLERIGIKSVTTAGFDGYAKNHAQNYFDIAMEYTFTNKQAEELNRYTSNIIRNLEDKLKVKFLTESYYFKEDEIEN